MNLYELNKAVRDVIDNGMSVDEETGEILFDESNLNELQIDLDTKIENTALYIKNLEAEAEAIKKEEINLKARREYKERYIERLKNYVLCNIPDKKFETSKCSLTKRTTKYVNVIDGSKLLKEYLTEKTTVTPNKTAIKKAIENGELVEGATLDTRESITVK